MSQQLMSPIVSCMGPTVTIPVCLHVRKALELIPALPLSFPRRTATAWPSAPAASRRWTSPLRMGPSGFWAMFSSVSFTPSLTVAITGWGWPPLSLRAVTSRGAGGEWSHWAAALGQGRGCHRCTSVPRGGEDTWGLRLKSPTKVWSTPGSHFRMNVKKSRASL